MAIMNNIVLNCSIFVCELYFRDLVARSLFQRSSGNTLSYVMHDLVHDLAQFVSGEFCCWLEGDNSHCITERTRHLSYSQSDWVPWNTFKTFEELPADMHKLANLSHLDLTGTNIKEMPAHMGKLKRLQTLALFSVGKQSGTSIGELKQLNDLGGKISILELQNVKGPVETLGVSLKDKKHLEGLRLEWSSNSGDDSRKDRDVLEKLQPHTSLKSS
ncbi:hypothetical protein RCOM_0999580 [Ricinus communis]|uniref:Uncharacterized protein n=1 Tax=Ricinus communis TaxID=3988 RepID=B9RZL0_RICCO|nr:hypothetical protein RCOM_0999580 [Ricinus communis]